MTNTNQVASTATKNVEKTLKGIKVVGVTSPSNIARIAKEQGLNPQEVYVRMIYNYEGIEYQASQKLHILGQSNYEKLRDLAGKEDTIDITLNVGKNSKGEISAFFYVEDNTTVEDLFATPLEKTQRKAAPDTLLKALGIKLA